jgi:hypothetical protein
MLARSPLGVKLASPSVPPILIAPMKRVSFGKKTGR